MTLVSTWGVEGQPAPAIDPPNPLVTETSTAGTTVTDTSTAGTAGTATSAAMSDLAYQR